MSNPVSNEEVVAATLAWLDAEVIGLNLCPFARAVRDAGQIRTIVTDAETLKALRAVLVDEVLFLKAADPAQVDTTLIIHPRVLADFLDYNDFLDEAEGVIEDLGLVGEFQIASFHPRYQFAGTAPDDVTNRTNRSPYPMLQLLRESSVEQAVTNYPDAEKIPERNIELMRRLGDPPASPEGGEKPPPA